MGRDVTFPDGTKLRALSLQDRKEDDPTREYGLYLAAEWQPTWPAQVAGWEDLGLPVHYERAAEQIQDAFYRAKAGQRVEVGCKAGLGRTGTVLACMAVLAGEPAEKAVGWVRENYHSSAVEGEDQARWVLWFDAYIRNAKAPPRPGS